MIDVEHIGGISFGQRLYLIAVNIRADRSISCGSTGYERQVLYFHLLPCHIETDIPVPVFSLNRGCVYAEFDTLTVYISYVCSDITIEGRPGCGGNRGNQVLCLAGVVVEATCNAVFQEAEVESDVPGSSCFPFQIGHIGTGTVGMNVSVTHAGFRTVLALSVNRQVIIIADTVLLSGHTIAGTELQVTQYFIVFQERFFCHSPA